jgi:hypothetical protein
MKKIKILFAFLAISATAFSQKLVKTYWDSNNTKIQSVYYENANGKANGSVKRYFYDGGIFMEGSFKDDYPIGKWTENYSNGHLHFIKTYTTPGYANFDVKDGKIISYYEDGKTLRYEKNFKDGKLDGEYKEYNENGTLTTEGKYVNGVLERTGESKRIYDEQQAAKEQEALRINNEKYHIIIQDADKAYELKEYKKALELYKSASEILGNEKYPRDAISAIIENFNTSSTSIYEFVTAENKRLINDFNKLKADFKIKTILQYDYPKMPERVSSYSNYYNYEISCNCEKPWDEQTAVNALKCFEINKEFYEPYQIAITEAFFKYEEALTKETENADKLYIRFDLNGFEYEFTTYDKSTFLNNLEITKENFELSKSLKTDYLKASENKAKIISLNEQNKKKTLLKKYLMAYEDLMSKINAYPGLSETIALLKSLNTVSDKVLGLYTQETKDLEKKLGDAETTDQIQAIILGN